MQLRGVNINCELTREAQFYSQLHGDTPAGTVEPGLPFRKTWPDETDEVNLMKKKMHRRPNDQLSKCPIAQMPLMSKMPLIYMFI